jgi:fatty-acyl-CoA synthase
MQSSILVARARSHTVGDIPRRSARSRPDKVAIIDGDVTLTFAEFDRLVDRAAAALTDHGFGAGDRIALLAHNCWQFAVLAFATARAAVVLVPINFMLTADEIAFILGHSKADGFIVEADLARTAEQAVALSDASLTTAALVLPGQALPSGWDDFAHWLTTERPAPTPQIADDQLLRLMYTSGTESRPKGVMHTSAV